MSTPLGFWNTNGYWKSIRKGSRVNENDQAYSFQLNKNWSVRAKNTKFMYQPIVFLLSVSTFCLLNWPHWRYSVISVPLTWLASILPAIWLYYWNKDKINDRGSDLRHDDSEGGFPAWHVLLGNWPPQRPVSKQNTAFLPRIDKSSCPRSEPWSSYSVAWHFQSSSSVDDQCLQSWAVQLPYSTCSAS